VIVVCGEALIDVIRGRDGREHSMPGGGPFNTARALARLGVPVAFLGRLSTDPAGRRLADLLSADGVDLRLASFGPEPTTHALATVQPDGTTDYEFFYEGTSAPNLAAEMLPVQLRHEVDAIHVGTLGLVFDPIASSLAGLLERERAGRLVMVDPNVRCGLIDDVDYRARLDRFVAGGTVVKASAADMEFLQPGTSVEDGAAALLRAGPALVVVTLGERGAFAAHRDVRVHVPAPHVDVVDTIGAGDAFGAGLLAWLHDHGKIADELSLDERELRAAAGYACQVAAITCSRRGADPPWKRELELAGDQAR
jgi:fructokinase